MNSHSCPVCGNSTGNQDLIIREMMFGLREDFAYTVCSNCGAISINEVPTDLARHYPPNYYSLQWQPPQIMPQSTIKQILRNWRRAYLSGHFNPIGLLLAKTSKYPEVYNWIRPLKLNTNTRILDVGCGSGQVLHNLGFEGFTNLTGIDPFNKAEINYPEFNIHIYNQYLSTHQGEYDVILYSHVFEHTITPAQDLAAMKRLLAPNGVIVLRTPLADSEAFQRFGVDWVQLDAPRHLIVHTRKSIDFLLTKVGLKLQKVVYDSTGFQFWGSMQYQKDIPLRDPESLLEGGNGLEVISGIGAAEFQDLKRQAQKLNKLQQGDQANFYITH